MFASCSKNNHDRWRMMFIISSKQLKSQRKLTKVTAALRLKVHCDLIRRSNFRSQNYKTLEVISNYKFSAVNNFVTNCK